MMHAEVTSSRWVSWPPHNVLHFLLSMFLWLKSCLGVLGKISHGTAAAHEKGDLNLLRSQVLMLRTQILYGRDGGCSTESSFRVGGLGEKEGGQGRPLFLDQACHWECILRDIALIGVFYFCFFFLLSEYPDAYGFVTPHSPLWILTLKTKSKMNVSFLAVSPRYLITSLRILTI